MVEPATPSTASIERRRVVRTASASGGMLELHLRWRPVIDLRRGARRGLALDRDLFRLDASGGRRAAAVETLGPVDQQRSDLVGLETALGVLPPATEAGRPPLIFLPVSWASAAAPPARRRLLRLVGRFEAQLRAAAVAELVGLEAGLPQAALREAAGGLQPIFRGVLAHLQPTRRAIAAAADCGLTGPAVDARDLSDAADEAAVLRVVLALHAVGSQVLFHRVRSVAALNAAKAAGVSWASLDLGGAPVNAKTAAEGPAAVS